MKKVSSMGEGEEIAAGGTELRAVGTVRGTEQYSEGKKEAKKK